MSLIFDFFRAFMVAILGFAFGVVLGSSLAFVAYIITNRSEEN